MTVKVNIPAGRYVVAVSGGVDSMVLLDLLAKQPDLELIVAHYNHGIRPAADGDEEFVRRQAVRYGLSFEAGRGKLGPGASEDKARRARYSFLNSLQQKYEAAAIMAAHHQDDLIETAFINVIRGTGPKGVYAISANNNILRPLLDYPKSTILKYAKDNGLRWVEDVSNQDESYLRNYIRKRIVPAMSPEERSRLLQKISAAEAAYSEVLGTIGSISKRLLVDELTLDRSAFISLPHPVATTFLNHWLLDRGTSQLDRPTIERLTNAIKTAPAGSRHEVRQGRVIKLTKEEANLSQAT